MIAISQPRALTEKFTSMEMEGAVRFVERLETLQAAGNMPPCVRIVVSNNRSKTEQTVWLGSPNGSHSVWDSLENLSDILSRNTTSPELCRWFDNVLGHVSGRVEEYSYQLPHTTSVEFVMHSVN